MSDRKVQGFCPMGCGETLFLGSGGYVTCSLLGCPNPTAASDIIAERETEHIVVLGASSFDIQHPLRERLDGALFRCELHQRLTTLDGPPAAVGRYRVHVGERMHWEPLAESAAPVASAAEPGQS